MRPKSQSKFAVPWNPADLLPARAQRSRGETLPAGGGWLRGTGVRAGAVRTRVAWRGPLAACASPPAPRVPPEEDRARAARAAAAAMTSAESESPACYVRMLDVAGAGNGVSEDARPERSSRDHQGIAPPRCMYASSSAAEILFRDVASAREWCKSVAVAAVSGVQDVENTHKGSSLNEQAARADLAVLPNARARAVATELANGACREHARSGELLRAHIDSCARETLARTYTRALVDTYASTLVRLHGRQCSFAHTHTPGRMALVGLVPASPETSAAEFKWVDGGKYAQGWGENQPESHSGQGEYAVTLNCKDGGDGTASYMHDCGAQGVLYDVENAANMLALCTSDSEDVCAALADTGTCTDADALTSIEWSVRVVPRWPLSLSALNNTLGSGAPVRAAVDAC